MSLIMLIFGMGRVSAQQLQLGAPTPASGATIQLGSSIEFDIPEEALAAGMVYILYTLNDASQELKPTFKELQQAQENMFIGLPYKVALAADDMEGGVEWMLPVVISTGGQVTLRARLAVPAMGGDAGDDDFGTGGGTLTYSEMVTATYTVEGEAEKLLPPTFSPAGGEVEPKTEVAIASGYEESEEEEYAYMLVYVIDQDDAALDISSLNDLT
ncbi:MAG: hypothetical protein K2O01_01775, partial [Bacteroidales bacterium]|nr:hypothetical protein [Bacteroidales bacterium]